MASPHRYARELSRVPSICHVAVSPESYPLWDKPNVGRINIASIHLPIEEHNAQVYCQRRFFEHAHDLWAARASILASPELGEVVVPIEHRFLGETVYWTLGDYIRLWESEWQASDEVNRGDPSALMLYIQARQTAPMTGMLLSVEFGYVTRDGRMLRERMTSGTHAERRELREMIEPYQAHRIDRVPLSHAEGLCSAMDRVLAELSLIERD